MRPNGTRDDLDLADGGEDQNLVWFEASRINLRRTFEGGPWHANHGPDDDVASRTAPGETRSENAHRELP